MKPLIITHGSCFDGFTCAWIARKYFLFSSNEEPDICFANYGEPPPDVTGRFVIMFDFSYKRPVLEEMKKKADMLVVVDHHKTAKEDLAGFPNCIFDMNRSGAQLAWDYFYLIKGTGKYISPVPKLVDYIADRDLWKFQLPLSQEINAAIASYPKTFERWDILEKSLVNDNGNLNSFIVAEGAAILRFETQKIEEMAATATEIKLPGAFKKFAGTTVVVANAPYVFASILGNKLAEMSPSKIGCAWFRRKDGKYQYSFRSIGDADVSAICSVMGGGGHRNAAGMESEYLLV